MKKCVQTSRLSSAVSFLSALNLNVNPDQLDRRHPQFTIWPAESLPYIWSLVLTVLVCIQCLCCLSGCTYSSPSRVCAGRPLHPAEPLPQHHLQLQLAAAVGPAGLHLWPLPHTRLVPVSDFWQASEHAHPVCGGKWFYFVKHLAKTQTEGFISKIWLHACVIVNTP